MSIDIKPSDEYSKIKREKIKFPDIINNLEKNFNFINDINKNFNQINTPEEKLDYLYSQLIEIHKKSNVDDESIIQNINNISIEQLITFINKIFIKLKIYQVYIHDYNLGSIMFFQKPFLLKYFEYLKSIYPKLCNKTKEKFTYIFNDLFLYLDENLFDKLIQLNEESNHEVSLYIQLNKYIKHFFDKLADVEIKYYQSTIKRKNLNAKNINKLKEIFEKIEKIKKSIKFEENINTYYYNLAKEIYNTIFNKKPINIEKHSMDEFYLWVKNSFIINNKKEKNNLQIIRLSINFVPISKNIFWYKLNKELLKDENYFITLHYINHCIDKLEKTFSEKHSYRVGELTKYIFEILLENKKDIIKNKKELNQIKNINKFYMILFGKIHDIGKLFVNWIWLGYRDKLNDKFKYLKQHTDGGYLLLDTYFGNLPVDLKEYLLQGFLHHESKDGTGYPWGLKNDIPLLSQIIKIADIIDAILSKRYYDDAKDINYIYKELKKEGEKNKIDNELINIILKNEKFGKIINKIYG